MYLVLEGEVQLKRDGREITVARRDDVFGGWALFDDKPREMSATSLTDAQLLRIDKEEFYDLLADHPELNEGIFKALSLKAKSLIQRIRK